MFTPLGIPICVHNETTYLSGSTECQNGLNEKSSDSTVVDKWRWYTRFHRNDSQQSRAEYADPLESA